MNEKFPDPYEGMTDEEIEEEALRIFDEPETAVSLTIPVGFLEQIKALARRRSGEPVHQLMVRALNLGIHQIEDETSKDA